ncbi:MFS transporter, partial [Chloroflexota bacterium]
ISWNYSFSVYLVGIPLGILALITVPQTSQERSKKPGGEGSVLTIFRNTHILFGIYGLQYLSMVLLYVTVVFLPQLLDTAGISNPFYISLFLVVATLTSALTSLVYGKIKSELSYKMIVLVTVGLFVAAFCTISQSNHIFVIVFSLVLFGIGRGIIFPALPVWVGETVPAAFRGRIISYLSTIGYIGQFSSPLVFGPFFSMGGFSSIFLAAGVICIVVFLLSVVLIKGKGS